MNKIFEVSQEPFLSECSDSLAIKSVKNSKEIGYGDSTFVASATYDVFINSDIINCPI